MVKQGYCSFKRTLPLAYYLLLLLCINYVFFFYLSVIYNNLFCTLLFFPSVVKLYIIVRLLIAGGSDQPESLRYFGLWAHFIFHQLCNVCNSFSLSINVLL